MRALLIASVVVVSASPAAYAEPSRAKPGRAEVVQPAPWFLLQRRSTPDTSMPGSTAPGNPVLDRPAYTNQQELYYAAELRRCETIGERAERLACKNSVRSKFGEM